MSSYEKDLSMSVKIAEKTAEKGGCCYYVGGFVRDRILGKENKDIDIEVHGITPQELAGILDNLGNRIEMGASFGIFGLRGYDLDIAMPRKAAALRSEEQKEFSRLADPFIGTYEAARRRDLTMNALMQNILTGEILDHFGGVEDIRKGVIRHVDEETFAEDPLRVLRTAQFAARFGFAVAEETLALCRKIDDSGVSRERIEEEVMKGLLKSTKPSVFFEILREMQQLSFWFPEVESLIGVEQNPRHHAEGDVWNHTMLVLDAAAELKEKVIYPEGFMLAALTHDLGKAVCTENIDGEWHAYQHETKGLPVVKTFLNRITNEVKLTRYVLNMTEHHMKPNVLARAGASTKSFNRMFDESLEPLDLIYLAEADERGRRTQYDTCVCTEMLLEHLKVFEEMMARPYVTGKDLIQAGLKPDKNFSEILRFAHKLRLAGVEKESALKQTLANFHMNKTGEKI